MRITRIITDVSKSKHFGNDTQFEGFLRIYIGMLLFMYVRIVVRMYVRIFLCMNVDVFVSIYVYMFLYIHVCMFPFENIFQTTLLNRSKNVDFLSNRYHDIFRRSI